MNAWTCCWSRKVARFALPALALLATVVLSAGAAEIEYADFSDPTGLTINGDAVANVDNGIDPNPVLRLTPDAGSQAGSAFSTATVSATGFATTFEFRITKTDGWGADGIVFVIQPVSSSSGSSGGGIGYEGITPSVGVEFDTFINTGDPSDSHVGIDLNGVVTHPDPGYVSALPVQLDDGDKWTAWVDYNGQTVEVRTNTTGVRPAEPLLTRDVNVATLFGQDTAYIGFTSATGGFSAAHDVVSWSYRVTQVIWDGDAANGSWTAGTNWDGDTAPQAGDQLVFAGNTETTVDNDLPTVEYGSLSFADGAGTFIVGGNAVQIAGDGYVRNSSANTQTIDLAVTGNGVLTIDAAAGDLTFGDLTIGGATTVTGENNVTVGGVLDGAGALAKSGAGTLTLSGDNTYAGGTELSGGRVVLGHANALGTGGVVVSFDTSLIAAVDLGAPVTNAVTVNDNMVLAVKGAQDIELSGTISGDGGVLVEMDAADDVVTLSGTNTFAGQATVGQGVLVITGGSAIGDTAPVGVVTGARLVLDADETIGSLAGMPGSAVDLDDSTLTFGDANDKVFVGVISDDGANGGALVKLGAGTQTLNGANTYGGGTELAAGEMIVGHFNALGTGTVNVSGDAALGAGAVLAEPLPNNVAIGNGATLTLTGTENLALGGDITGAGALTVNTAAADDVVTLAGTNGYTGGTTVTRGVLQGDTTSLQGAITNNTAVVFDQAGDGTYAGDMDGSGSLTKLGTGALTLGGTNAYTGGTTVSAGTLRGDTASLQGPITNDDAVVFDQDGDGTYAGDMDGGGSLTKLGAGDVTLGGTNTYTGGTTVSGGELWGDTDSLQGDIVNDTVVVFRQDTDGAYDGNMSGVGLLFKDGTGTVTLTGTNTHTGDTYAAFGVLVGDTDSLQRQIINESQVIFDQDANGTYAGKMLGTGSLVKRGAGILTLSGASPDFTGTTTVDAGTLVLDGSVAGNVVVNNATFGGVGTIGGDLTVNTAGAFAPGNSIGTTTVTGDYVLDGTLEIEVNKPDDTTREQDQVVVGGSATLGADSQITVTKLDGPGVFLIDDEFPIITAAGGIVDAGTEVVSNSAFVDFTGSVVGNDYVLTTQVTSQFAAQATAGNRELAEALDAAAPTATGDMATVINQLLLLDAGQFNEAARRMNPEPHLATLGAVTRAIHRQGEEIAAHLRRRRTGGGYLDAVSSLQRDVWQLRQAGGALGGNHSGVAGPVGENPNRDETPRRRLGGWAFFAKPFAATFRQESSSEHIGYDGQSYGVQIGADTWLAPNLLAGLSLSYAHTEIAYAHHRGQGDVETLRFGPFATFTRGGLFLDAAATCAFHWQDVERDVVIGPLRRQADADYHAHDASVYLGGGYDLHLSAWTVTPTASLQYTAYRQDGFTESGAGAAGLRVGAETVHWLRSRVGLGVSRAIDLGKITLVPEAFGGWEHEYFDDPRLEASFLGSSARFTTEQKGLPGDSAYFGAGVSAEMENGPTLFFRYEGALSDQDSVHLFSVGVKVSL